MSNLVTTNIRLPREMIKALKIRAAEEGKNMSFLIREAVEEYLSEKIELTPSDYDEDPFAEIMGLVASGTKDGSVAHDRYLYGQQTS